MRKLLFLALAIVSFNAVFAQTAFVPQAPFIPLADSVGKWSEYQYRTIQGPGSPEIQLRTKVVKHFGFTAIIMVEITNKSKTQLSHTMGLKPTNNDANDNTIHINNSNTCKLKPNYYAEYKMEMRLCRPKGKKDDMEIVRNCQPRLLFPSQTILYNGR